jgi:hypothetical protein
LNNFDTLPTYWFGMNNFSEWSDNGTVSVGSGYITAQEALEFLIEMGLPDTWIDV